MFDWRKPKVSIGFESNTMEVAMTLGSKGYPFTKAGVKKFQKDNDLVITGDIDPITYTVIMESVG